MSDRIQEAAEAVHATGWVTTSEAEGIAQALADAGFITPDPAWLGEVVRKARAAALRDAAAVYGPGQITFMGSATGYTKAWLVDRADRKEAPDE